MAAVAEPKGLKRICMSCGTRFYDLNKNPIMCPNCNVEFTGEVKTKARRGRLAANDVVEEEQVKEEVVEEEVEVVAAEEDAEVVSLEEVEEDDDLDDEDIALDDDIDDIDDLDDDDDDIEEIEEVEKE